MDELVLQLGVTDLSRPSQSDEKQSPAELMIMDMGFTLDEAREALAEKKDMEASIEWLLEQRQAKEEREKEQQRQKEMKEREVLERKRLAKQRRDAYRGVPNLLRFGSIVAMRSVKYHRYLEVTSLERAPARVQCSQPSEQCLLVLVNPDQDASDHEADDMGVIFNHDKVALQAHNGAFLAVEADGVCYAGRTGVIDLFMQWRLVDASHDDPEQPLSSSSFIHLESAIRNLLVADAHGACVANSPKPCEAAQWMMCEQIQKANRRASIGPVPELVLSPSSRTASARWNRLKAGYRLAALRIQKLQAEEFRAKIEKQRKEIQRKIFEEKDRSCVVCLDETPNTVILECGHVCVCEGCGKLLEDCPVCRSIVTRVVLLKHVPRSPPVAPTSPFAALQSPAHRDFSLQSRVSPSHTRLSSSSMLHSPLSRASTVSNVPSAAIGSPVRRSIQSLLSHITDISPSNNSPLLRPARAISGGVEFSPLSKREGQSIAHEKQASLIFAPSSTPTDILPGTVLSTLSASSSPPEHHPHPMWKSRIDKSDELNH